ncbi:MAG: DUF3048 domain-containing protein [Acidobacteria bacterium]|nr:DUF3048 domain-containing protein [Acidobacteriota bacterium]
MNRSQRLAAAGAATLVLALGACSGGSSHSPLQKSAGAEDPSTTSTTAALVAPLTGLPAASGTNLDRPALIVKVDSTPKAFPLQQGLDKADVVVVEQVEGGMIRFAVVFHSKDATVGPVRSARTSDLAIAPNFDDPLFTCSGGNSGVMHQISSSAALVDSCVSASGMASIFERNKHGSSLYRYFLPTAEVYSARAGSGGTPEALFDFRTPGAPAAGELVDGARINYKGIQVAYEWNGTGWARSQNGRAQFMAGGGPRIAPANVVILSTPYKFSGYVDVTGAPSPEAVLVGSGSAWFLSGGKAMKGSWSRTSGGKFTFTDPSGQPAELTPGQTWLELAPGASASSLVLPPTTTTTAGAATTHP